MSGTPAVARREPRVHAPSVEPDLVPPAVAFRRKVDRPCVLRYDPSALGFKKRRRSPCSRKRDGSHALAIHLAVRVPGGIVSTGEWDEEAEDDKLHSAIAPARICSRRANDLVVLSILW